VATAVTLLLPALSVSVTLPSAETGVPEPAWKVFWTTFGASNQLLAALTLLGLTVWLSRSGHRRVAIVTALPMAFMMAMTLWSLGLMVARAWRRIAAGGGIEPPAIVGCVLIVLAVLLVVLAGRALARGPIAGRGAAARP
jgi:carbon starvation protein